MPLAKPKQTAEQKALNEEAKAEAQIEAREEAALEAADEAADAIPPVPGFHVTINGVSCGCYPTAADAEAFAIGQIGPQGLDYEIIEV
jgi:hypothetical protein